MSITKWKHIDDPWVTKEDMDKVYDILYGKEEHEIKFTYRFADGFQCNDNWLNEDTLIALVEMHGKVNIGFMEEK